LNRHGEPPARTRAEADRLCAGADAPLLVAPDGSDAGGAPPSTVVDLTATPPRVLRAGALDRDAIRRALGPDLELA
jgi:tRNA A37 threonylcarbamoyladenosine synthetase subunit TsaC/SUA5/YrdC